MTRPTRPPIPEKAWRNADAGLVWHRMKLTAAVVARPDRCRLVVRLGAGFDNVDGAALRVRGIPLANVPNYGTTEVADHALAMLLHLTRDPAPTGTGCGRTWPAASADLRADRPFKEVFSMPDPVIIG